MAATKPFAVESRARSWWHLLSTFGVILGAGAIAVLAPWWPVQAAAGLLMSLTMIRGFIHFHDLHHGAILRNSPVASAILNFYGLIMLTPRAVWRHTHNYHHAHTAQTDGEQLGTNLLLTTEQWRRTGRMKRMVYRIERHPLTTILGYFTVFLINFALVPFLQHPRKYWDSGLAILVHAAVGAAMYVFGGPAVFFFAFLMPFLISGAAGTYLFYIQHNFEAMSLPERSEWNHTEASLEASSFVKFGPVMQWFTGNIGFHHIHHLNPRIPFYRLPEALDAIPEFQKTKPIVITPRVIARSFRLKLWDPATQQMVGYPRRRA